MYRKVNVSIFCIVLFFSSNILAQQFTSEQFKLPVSVSIRAIQCINDYTLWFSGSKGVFGYTQDGGKTFIVDSLRTDTNIFDFRSLAVLNDTTILLINAGSPARIFKSTDKGKTWRTVYSNNSDDIFFDGLRFANEKFGYALADPIGGCFQILKTTDGGET